MSVGVNPGLWIKPMLVCASPQHIWRRRGNKGNLHLIRRGRYSQTVAGKPSHGTQSQPQGGGVKRMLPNLISRGKSILWAWGVCILLKGSSACLLKVSNFFNLQWWLERETLCRWLAETRTWTLDPQITSFTSFCSDAAVPKPAVLSSKTSKIPSGNADYTEPYHVLKGTSLITNTTAVHWMQLYCIVAREHRAY